MITAENHSIIGGLGSAVAETLAEAALPRPLHRLGLTDTFAEGARTASYLFTKYGLTTQHLINTAWSALDQPGTPPRSPPSQPKKASTPPYEPPRCPVVRWACGRVCPGAGVGWSAARRAKTAGRLMASLWGGPRGTRRDWACRGWPAG